MDNCSWEAPPGSLFSFTIPANWTAGRIWVRFFHDLFHSTKAMLNCRHATTQGRRDCNFTGANANQAASCSTGGCIGGLLCDPNDGTVSSLSEHCYRYVLTAFCLKGVPPATLGEWTIDANGVDNYDGKNYHLSYSCPILILDNLVAVSIVDGSNIPLSITNNKGCPVASCPKDLGPDCEYPYFSIQRSVQI